MNEKNPSPLGSGWGLKLVQAEANPLSRPNETTLPLINGSVRISNCAFILYIPNIRLRIAKVDQEP